jgi:uncharacterized membrane protein
MTKSENSGNFGSWFFQALFFLLPAALTVWVAKLVLGWGGELSSFVHFYFIGEWESSLSDPLQWLVKTGVSMATLVLVVIGLWILGNLLTIRLFGRMFTGLRNRLFNTVPVLNIVYRFFLNLIEKVKGSFGSSGSLGVPCLLQYPREGLWVQGFLTKTYTNTVDGKELGVVQVYTAPNPIGGILVVAPVDELILCKAPLSEAVEYSISLGTVMSNTLLNDLSEAVAGQGKTTNSKLSLAPSSDKVVG